MAGRGRGNGSGRRSIGRKSKSAGKQLQLPVFGGGTPEETLDKTDVGDETQRNFRYQHAYAVILLIAAVQRRLPYRAIWCEHHEDILAERSDGQWDGYQVKTRRREYGDWKLTDTELCAAIKHLTTLHSRFPGKIGDLHIVSNARFLDRAGSRYTARSLPKLLSAAVSAGSPDGFKAPFKAAFSKLASDTEHSSDALFAALRKLRLVNGPQRESFDAEVAHDHVPHLDGCANLPRSKLNGLRDELVARVYRASSLSSDDPSRHWHCVTGADRDHPQLAAKRVTVEDVLTIVADRRVVPFRYLPGTGSLVPGEPGKKVSTIPAKLLAAGLQSQIDMFTTRMLAAERRLLEAAELDPEKAQTLIDQIESVVRGEYAEALLVSEQKPVPYGRELLMDVYARLRGVAEKRPEMVQQEPYETLAGVAAMLTAECQFWWGPRFNIGGSS